MTQTNGHIEEKKLPSEVLTKEGYKLTKLGWIPEDWKILLLGKLASVSSGGTPDRKKPVYWNGEIPWVTTSLIDFNEIDKANEFITQEGLDNSAAKVFPENTILMALYGQGKTRGKVGVLKIPATTNQACAAIIPKKESVVTNYLFYHLAADYVKIRNLSNTGNQENLSGELVKSIQLRLPPLPEQKAIAAILSKWDLSIEKLSELISLKAQKQKGLMQQLLTGKKRFAGFEEEWREVKLGSYFKERREIGMNDLRLLSIGANGVYPQSDSIKKDTSNSDKSKYKLICVGDIGYNTMRMWQGRSALSKLEGIVSPAYTIVTPLKNADSAFFAYLFKLPEVVYKFFRNSQGLVNDTLNCKYKDFAIVRVLVPPSIGEQQKIATVLNAAEQELVTLRAKLEGLKEQKKGLMQQLLTGKVRVKI